MLYRFLKKNVILALLALTPGCTKEYTCPIPNIDWFEFTVVIRTDDVLTAQTRGNVGYKKHGIIIYHHYDDEVHAFDATCANSAECVEDGVVVFDGDGKVTATCKRCKSQYYLRDGKHLHKRVMLRPYNVWPKDHTMEQYEVSNRNR